MTHKDVGRRETSPRYKYERECSVHYRVKLVCMFLSEWKIRNLPVLNNYLSAVKKKQINDGCNLNWIIGKIAIEWKDCLHFWLIQAVGLCYCKCSFSVSPWLFSVNWSNRWCHKILCCHKNGVNIRFGQLISSSSCQSLLIPVTVKAKD